jgi:hypothetical protein
VGILLQWRIFFLGVGRMAGRGSWIHVDGGMKVCSHYEIRFALRQAAPAESGRCRGIPAGGSSEIAELLQRR